MLLDSKVAGITVRGPECDILYGSGVYPRLLYYCHHFWSVSCHYHYSSDPGYI